MLPTCRGRPPPWALAASIVQAGEAGPGLLSFPETLCAGRKEPISPRPPWLLPRPKAQVSRALPISQPAFPLCLREHRGLAPSPFGLWSLAGPFRNELDCSADLETRGSCAGEGLGSALGCCCRWFPTLGLGPDLDHSPTGGALALSIVLYQAPSGLPLTARFSPSSLAAPARLSWAGRCLPRRRLPPPSSLSRHLNLEPASGSF